MTCPNNPLPPDGFRVWRKPVPKELADWAVALCNGEMQRVNYGTTWSTWYTPPGGSPEAVVARKDYHTWSHIRGKLVTGLCISGITLYEPIPSAAFTAYNPAADSIDAPDVNAAMFNDGPPGPDWGLVGASAAAGLGIVGLFFLALKSIGPSKAPRRRTR